MRAFLVTCYSKVICLIFLRNLYVKYNRIQQRSKINLPQDVGQITSYLFFRNNSEKIITVLLTVFRLLLDTYLAKRNKTGIQILIAIQTRVCVKSVRIWSYSGQYSVRIRESTDQNNFEYGHFLRIKSLSVLRICKSFYEFIVPWFTFKTCSNYITGNRIDMKLEPQTQIEKEEKTTPNNPIVCHDSTLQRYVDVSAF